MAAELRGRVVPGAGEGRTTGYPTANLALPPGTARPNPGIYVCWVERRGERHGGLLVSGVHWEGTLPRVEVYLINFSGDLYGEELGVEVVGCVRKVEQFTDQATLRQRIEQDIEAARTMLGL